MGLVPVTVVWFALGLEGCAGSEGERGDAISFGLELDEFVCAIMWLCDVVWVSPGVVFGDGFDTDVDVNCVRVRVEDGLWNRSRSEIQDWDVNIHSGGRSDEPTTIYPTIPNTSTRPRSELLDP